MCFLLAFTPAKRTIALHGPSFRIWHSKGGKSCICSYVPDFVAKIQNPSFHDPRLEEFMVPSLDDFMDGDGDELPLLPIRELQK